MIRAILALLSILVGMPHTCRTQQPSGNELPLRVLFVGELGTERGQDFLSFLGRHFVEAKGAERKTYPPEGAVDTDVVVLDWPQEQREEFNGSTPLGQRQSWRKPTVLLGSAGLLVAEQWQTRGWFG